MKHRLRRTPVSVLLWVAVFCVPTAYAQPPDHYDEPYRPQYHFTAEKNWLNDPNGLVFYKGEYHLFYQHNPFGTQWGYMHWGHAVSEDLVHWKHLPIAIRPDKDSKDKSYATAYSGSGVVDWNNTSGFQTGSEPPIVLFYTSWRCGQNIAYSNDRGRTWRKYEGNSVIPFDDDDARDPKVIWHADSARWVMVLYRRPENDQSKQGISFYTSTNLKDWQFQSHTEDFYECPDLFELPVLGDAGGTKWILLGGDGKYIVGSFDGRKFTKESDKHILDYGANFYASQTWSDIPKSDGRRIQIAWMRGGEYPDSKWNQQMSFPCSLTLRQSDKGLRVYRNPVQEIETVYTDKYHWVAKILSPRENILSGAWGDLFEIKGVFRVIDADEFGFRVRTGRESEGTSIVYDVRNREISCLGCEAPLDLESGRIEIHILLDRSSLEVFGNSGRVSMSSCFLPANDAKGLEVYTKGGKVEIVSLTVNKLGSAWRD